MENVRNRLGLEFIEKVHYKKLMKQKSKMTFSGFLKSYEICEDYLFKKNEVVMDQPNYLEFVVFELSKLHLYESYYDKLPPFFGKENFQLHYIDTDAFVLSVNTNDIIRGLRNLEDIFDFSNLDENHGLFSMKNKKVFRKSKIETPENIWFDEFVCLRSKMFKCGDDCENKLKGITISQSKRIKFEEFYNCLFGGKFQKGCDNYINQSINLERYLQQLKKTKLSLFDDKRCYIKKTQSKPWNYSY